MIVLVQMPYAAIEHPSLALGLLHTEMQRRGLPCRSLYPNLDWRRRLGSDAYHAICATLAEDLVGEWTFSEAAFGAIPEREESFLRRVCSRASLARRSHSRELLRQARAQAGAFLDEVVERILALQPRLVGCSSTFQQHCASLALLRRLKTRDPRIFTVMGGANCEGPMGVAVVRNFSWIDYVVSGEADQVAGPLFSALLEGRSERPYGVLSQRPESWEGPPRATFNAMDQVAVPHYDDYFRELDRSGLDLLPGLLMETSRGCWWGQKHHCTFCGLNAGGMGYRSKSGPRVLDELESLSQRYQLGGFEVVDNILDHAHLKSIMPVLAARPEGWRFFYETKSNLKRHQLQLLAQAGVLWIQPGIESLHDEVLRLMDKGSTALMNLQLLKHAREFGIRVVWNFLACFPNEKDEWYQEMASWLPLVHHLQPAGGVSPIRYDRFSPYHTHPERYGIAIRPSSTYQAVYPLADAELADLAYFFEDQEARWDRQMTTPGRVAVQAALEVWKTAFWAPIPCILSMVDQPNGLDIVDTRAVARQRRHLLQGRERELLLECETPRRLQPEPALDTLLEKKLLLHLGDFYLALPVAGSLPSLPRNEEFPGGYHERPAHIKPYRGGVYA
ncbi:MAG: RiPP maturation radical SAM C-methyltransferase [Candidatus Eremiobacteraeota bacterium]|nr:RiPP maturation radical SAM C-methyltransferase [Candidatus Eremiobacteraeota bacterium]MCW5867069.1 RiPP maturation radical SAM C-methyltransferase [Candidatus Eremiobacteraeota bacterium]